MKTNADTPDAKNPDMPKSRLSVFGDHAGRKKQDGLADADARKTPEGKDSQQPEKLYAAGPFPVKDEPAFPRGRADDFLEKPTWRPLVDENRSVLETEMDFMKRLAWFPEGATSARGERQESAKGCTVEHSVGKS